MTAVRPAVDDYLDLSLAEDGTVWTYRMNRTPDGCALALDARTRFASAGWFFFEDVQDILDVEFFLARFEAVLDRSSAIERTGTNITTLEITSDVSWLRVLGSTGRGSVIATGEFYEQVLRLKKFLRPRSADTYQAETSVSRLSESPPGDRTRT
jgi:hypothetical protein